MTIARDYLSRFRGFSREAKIFLLAMTVGSLGFSISWLMLNFYLESLGYSQSFIGGINSLSWLTMAAVGIPMGILSDRISRRNALLIGAMLSILGPLGVAVTGAPLPLAIFTVISGMGAATISTNMAPFMSEHSTVMQRTALFSVQAALATATGFFGNLLGGHLPELFSSWLGGAAQDVLPLRLTLAMVSVLEILALIPILYLPAGLAATPQEPTAKSLPHGGRRVGLDNPALFVKMLLPSVSIGLGAGLTMPFLNLFIAGKFGISFGDLGLLFGFSSLLTAAGMLLQPLLADRFGKVRSVVFVQGLSLPFLLMMGFSPYFLGVALALLVRGMLMNMANPVYMAFCMGQLPERERATFSGATEVVWSLTWAGSSAFSGWWRDQAGFEAGFNMEFALMALFYMLSTGLLYGFFGRQGKGHGGP